MLDNFSLLPKEAFEALGDFGNNLLDKLSSAVGFVFIPRGKRKDMEEAVQFFVDEIKKNDSMPLLARAAAISSARKTIKTYINQNDIVEIALSNLSDNSDINGVEDDWLSNFMDKAGNISGEDMKLIFGKILAEECNKLGSISRSLVNTLATMDRTSANSFRKLCTYVITATINGDLAPSVVIPSVTDFEKYRINMQFGEIVDLTSLGLIEYEPLTGYLLPSDEEEIVTYGNKRFKFKIPQKNIPCGQVNLTRSGSELFKIIVQDVDWKYFDKMKEYWKEKGIEIFEM